MDNNMPSQGTMISGTYQDVPERIQNALRVGIPMFQIVYPKRTYFDIPIMGVFGVKVSAIDDITSSSVGSKYHIEWQTAGDASMIFVADLKTGLATAWVPDDFHWHNRLVLMDNAWMMERVTHLRTPKNAIVSGEEIRMEIECLRDILKEKVPVYDVIRNGQPAAYFYNRDDAKTFIEEDSPVKYKTMPDGKIIPIKETRNKYEIKDNTKLEYKKSITTLINQEKARHKFGWTESQEFMEKIKPKVIELIKGRRKATTATAGTGGVNIYGLINSINSLSDDDRAKLRDAVIGNTIPEKTRSIDEILNEDYKEK